MKDKRQILIRAIMLVMVAVAVFAGWRAVQNAGPNAKMKAAREAAQDRAQAEAEARAEAGDTAQ